MEGRMKMKPEALKPDSTGGPVGFISHSLFRV
jgi:hypothetical protein